MIHVQPMQPILFFTKALQNAAKVTEDWKGRKENILTLSCSFRPACFIRTFKIRSFKSQLPIAEWQWIVKLWFYGHKLNEQHPILCFSNMVLYLIDSSQLVTRYWKNCKISRQPHRDWWLRVKAACPRGSSLIDRKLQHTLFSQNFP